MNIFPNNNPKEVVKPKKNHFPSSSGTTVAPYFQGYYPYSNYLDGPMGDCFGAPKKKNSFLTKALKGLAIATAGFIGIRFVAKSGGAAGIKEFFKQLLGK